MKTLSWNLCAAGAVAASLLAGCAAVVPQELAGARTAYARASRGPAAQLKPAELHKAAMALKDAELAFSDQPESYHTRDLAYVALRHAETVEAVAEAAANDNLVARSEAEYSETQSRMVKDSRQALDQSKSELADAERSGAQSAQKLAAEKALLAKSESRGADTAAQLAAEKTARGEAEKRAADAQAAFAKLAAVKEEARGLVITLSGSVLFASDKAELLPAAQQRLGQVADALLADRQRTLVIEGHTDSRGGDGHNNDLSLRRAEAVRSFLVSKGYDAGLVSAHGIGKSRPVADNSTAEGRANNRRVEIVIAPLAMR